MRGSADEMIEQLARHACCRRARTLAWVIFARALLVGVYLPRAVLLARAPGIFVLAFGDLARFVIGT